MGNSFENNKNQSSDSELKTFFKRDKEEGYFVESYRKALYDNSYRYSAAEAGTPIKKTDTYPDKMAFMKREETTYLKAVFKQDLETVKKESLNYRVPPMSQFIKKDSQKNILVQNLQEVSDYKKMTIAAPLEQGGVRDFRQADNFAAKWTPNQRVILQTEQGSDFENLTYDIRKLAIALLAESQSENEGTPGKNLSILPYPHMDEDAHLVSKSLIVLNSEQRELLRKFVFTDNLLPKL
jgi:hypothetical protein